MSAAGAIGSQAVIDALVSSGGVVSRLNDTNAQVVQLGGRDFYFIHDQTPATPFIYSVFAAQPVYIKAILSESGLRYGASGISGEHYHVLIAKSGFMTVLADAHGTGKASDVTVAARAMLESYAAKVLGLFPHAAFIVFTVQMKVSSRSDHDRCISDISFNFDRFVPYNMHYQETVRPVADVIAQLIISS